MARPASLKNRRIPEAGCSQSVARNSRFKRAGRYSRQPEGEHMRKEFGKVLRDYFSTRMHSLAPEYAAEKVKSMYLWPGERAFRRRIDDSLHCWIVLSPSAKDYDEFTVMVGWSNHARYPELSVIPSPVSPAPDHAEFSQPEYLIRLPQLWSGEDYWVIKPFRGPLTIKQLQASILPVTKQEAEALVVPQVDSALSRLMETGLPYLKTYIDFKQRQHG